MVDCWLKWLGVDSFHILLKRPEQCLVGEKAASGSKGGDENDGCVIEVTKKEFLQNEIVTGIESICVLK